MLEYNGIYPIYLSEFAVELRNENDEYFGSAGLVCSQRGYDNNLEYAQDLALRNKVCLRNYNHFNTYYEY